MSREHNLRALGTSERDETERDSVEADTKAWDVADGGFEVIYVYGS